MGKSIEGKVENQIQLLEQQIELEESNYRYALELRKDYSTLVRLKKTIKALKSQLQVLYKNCTWY